MNSKWPRLMLMSGAATCALVGPLTPIIAVSDTVMSDTVIYFELR